MKPISFDAKDDGSIKNPQNLSPERQKGALIILGDAQAFKRACSCFGLGRYFYDFLAIWVDLDQKGQPVKPPVLSSWALPENWHKGLRPPERNGEAKPEGHGKGSKSDNSGGNGSVFSQPTNGNSENGGKANGFRAPDSGDELDQGIRG